MQITKKLLATNWGILLLFALTALVVLSPVLVFGRTTFFTNLDNVDQFYTWYQKLAIGWHGEGLPIWNTNVYAGSSFAGEIQQGVFYPLNWLWVGIFGSKTGISELALNYLVATHFVIAAYGCFLLVKQMGAARWAAFGSGLVFAFSGALAMRSVSQTVIFFALAYVPYPAFFLVRYYGQQQRKARNLLFSGASLGFILLVGHIQPFFHAALIVAVFAFVQTWQRVSKAGLISSVTQTLKHMCLLGVAAGLVALPQVWVSASYLSNVYRVQAKGYVGPGTKTDYYEFASSFNLNPHEFANLVDPVSYPIRDGNDVFIGLAPLAIIALGFLLAKRAFAKNRLWMQHKATALSLLSLSLLALLGQFTWFAVVLYKLPVVYQIRQLGRYAVIFHLALAIILAVALESLAEQKINSKIRKAMLISSAFLAIEFVYLALLHDKIFGLHLAMQMLLLSAFLAALALIRSTAFRRAAFLVLLVLTMLVNTAWYLPKITAKTKLAVDYRLPVQLVDILEETSGKYRVEVQEDAIPINSGNVYDFQGVGGYSATIYASYFEFAHQSKFDPRLVSDLLGVRYIVSKACPDAHVVYRDEARHICVSTRESALPKMFISKSESSTNRTDYLPVPVETLAYEDDYQKYRVILDKPSNVIISEQYYPGWSARVDGQTASIEDYRVGDVPIFKELSLPAGEHTVELNYKAFKFF